MNRGAWWATVQRVAELTALSNQTSRHHAKHCGQDMQVLGSQGCFREGTEISSENNNGFSDGKERPAVQEAWVPSPSQKDPLEEEMATYSCILAWRIPWTEEPSGVTKNMTE